MTLFIFCLLLLASPAAAGTLTFTFGDAGDPITITTTANQDTKIQAVTDDYNKSKGCDVVAQTCPEGVTLLTRAAWLKVVLTDAVKNWVKTIADRDAKEACTNYKAASASTQNQIDTALGGKSPCA